MCWTIPVFTTLGSNILFAVVYFDYFLGKPENGMVMFNLANWYQTMWKDKKKFTHKTIYFFFGVVVVAATKKRETFTWIKCDLVKSNISCLDHHILKGGKHVGFLDVMLLVKRKVNAEKKNDKRRCQEAFGFVCIVTNSDRLTLCLSIIPMIQENVLQFIKPTFCWVFIFYASSLSNSHIKQWVQIELGILYICIHVS